MYNQIMVESAPAFYEIFRKHKSDDPRDAGYTYDYLLGTVDVDVDYDAILKWYQEQADVVVHAQDQYWTNGRLEEDKVYLDRVLAEFRKVDPGFYPGGRPQYRARLIERAAPITIPDLTKKG